MPEMPPGLRTVIQSMIDAGEPKEKIASVIQKFSTQQQQPQAPSLNPSKINTPQGPEQPYTGPDTFWGGVRKSLNPFESGGGEAISAGAEGGAGFMHGATLDLPGSILGAIGSAWNTGVNLGTDPIGTIKSIPQGLANIGQGIKDTTMQAGSDPYAFGRMMGQTTGQPLVTAGLVKAAPYAKAPVGRTIAGAGGLVERNQPFSSWIPRIAEPRILRDVQRWAGGKVRRFGENMAVPTKQGQVVPEVPTFTEGEVLPMDSSRGLPSATRVPPTAADDISEWNVQQPRTTPTNPIQMPVTGTGTITPERIPMMRTDAYMEAARRGSATHPNDILREWGVRDPNMITNPNYVPSEFLQEVEKYTPTRPELPPSQFPLGRPPQIPDASLMGQQSPTAGSHMNSPAQPHGIPPGPEPMTPPAAPMVESKMVPIKEFNPTIVQFMLEKGYTLKGVDPTSKFYRFEKL